MRTIRGTARSTELLVDVDMLYYAWGRDAVPDRVRTEPRTATPTTP